MLTRMNILARFSLLVAALLAAPGVFADTSYAQNAGSSVGTYRNEALNYQIDLDDAPYVLVDLSEQMPDASFAAMRFDPLVFTMTIAEDVGAEMSPGQYAEMVMSATRESFAVEGKVMTGAIRVINELEVAGRPALQLGFAAEVEGSIANYVITVFTKGSLAYQLTVFAGGVDAEQVRAEADTIASAFSFLSDQPDVTQVAKSVGDYRSEVFAYSLSANKKIWFPWSDIEDSYAVADIGALGAKGYGSFVMPFCWQGARPAQLALLDVFMEQFGEDYPTPFITEERPIEKGAATGLYLRGDEETEDGVMYRYEARVVSNETCAYMLGAWGPIGLDDTGTDLEALWSSLELGDAPSVFDDGVPSDKDTQINGFFLNQVGMHYLEARSYREAFRFLSQAANLRPDNQTFTTNALRTLSELDAYREAYDWLQPRLANFGDDQIIRSWDAWLAYQVNEPGKAIDIYSKLFAEGYREDDEFSIYMELLADREEWEWLDAGFDAYAGDDLTDSLRRLKANLLSRRGKHDEALAILDAMTAGRPFSAELIYARIEVYDAMNDMANVLTLADELIANKYESLESWFYKGYAEYGLMSYVKSRESFQTAKTFAPTNTLVQEYIDAINGILGEGDNASISAELRAVEPPTDLQRQLERAGWSNSREGYGAFFLNRMMGYDFDGGDQVAMTYFQQIKIQDAQGIEQFSTLEFEFDPAFESLYVNSLLVRDEDGEVIAEADRAAFYVTDTTDGYEASTEETAHLPVPSLAPGVVIDVVVTKHTNVETGEMPLDIHYLSASRPIEYSALFVNGKTGDVDYESFAVGEPRKSGKAIVWDVTDPVVYRWEPMQPYFDRLLPWVYAGTTTADWGAAGSEYFAKIEEKLDNSRVADTARRLVRDVDDNVRKVEIISRYVQKELHYEAIEFGRRAYIPNPPRETLRNRYGDCKDHAVLLYAMLKAVDVPAELALVNLSQEVLPGLPNVDQFNHMIVSVPTPDKRLFIDATDKDFYLGRMPPRYMAGNNALIIGEQSELVAIPDFEAGQSALRVEREIEEIDGNEIRVFEVGIFTGFQAAELRGQLRDIETSEMQATMQRWVAARYSSAVVDDAFVDHLLEADSELVVELQYRLPVDEDKSFKLPGFFEAEYLDYARVADRRFVFDLPAPFNVSVVTTVLQPGPHKISETSNKPNAGESTFGNWSRRIDKDEERWVLRLEYSGRHSEYSAEQYGEFAEFHRRLIGAIEQPVTLE